MNISVPQIKERWPIRAMAARLGIDLPSRDGIKFKNPFRPDENPSCSIFDDCFWDWSKDEHVDSIGLFALAKGLTNSEAIKQLAAEFPGAGKPLKTGAKRPPFSGMSKPTAAEISQIAELRGIHPSCLEKASDLGHFFTGSSSEGRCWIVTDSKRQVCQSRRLDGLPWTAIASKAWTSVKASGWAGWPIGIVSAKDTENILLCEGGPDFLCAHESTDAAPVAMLGAKQSIHAEAIPLFLGKRVRILAHGDDAGRDACRKWALQLADTAKCVTAVVISFGKAKDLNDAANMSIADWQKYNVGKLLSFTDAP